MSGCWPKVQLGEVLAERRDVPDPESLALGTIRIVSKIRFDLGKIELRQGAETKTGMILVSPGDLLLSGINAAKGAIAIYGRENTEPVAATIHYGAYSVVEDRADVDYLWWYLRSGPFRDILLDALPEGIKTELKASRLLPIEIPLPPLSEQRRIVARIGEVAAQINQARTLRQRALEETGALTKAELNSLVTQLLKKHETLSLAEVTTFIGDINHEMPRAVEDGIPFVSPRDFSPEGTIDFTRTKRISRSDFERLSKKCCPRREDILMARYGTVGEARIVETDLPFLASYSIAVIRPDQRKIMARYLHWMIVSPALQQQILGGIRGGIQADLGLKVIREFRIPVPPLPEQRRIVAELDAFQAEVDGLKRLQAETAAELDAILPAILDRAFKGEF